MPDKAIIIALAKKKGAGSEPAPDMKDKSADEDRLDQISKEMIEAFQKKDAMALRNLLCEFLHEYEETEDEDEDDKGEY